MPDGGLQITGETGARDSRGRFKKGRSGNPAGRPRGSVNRSTRAAMQLLDGEAEALTRKAVELALAGDPVALRLCLDRIIGARRGRPVAIALPPLDDAENLGAAAASVGEAAARGDVTPDEGLALSQILESVGRSFDSGHRARKRFWRGILWQASVKKAAGGLRRPWRVRGVTISAAQRPGTMAGGK